MQGLHTLKCPLPLPPVVGCLEHAFILRINRRCHISGWWRFSGCSKVVVDGEFHLCIKIHHLPHSLHPLHEGSDALVQIERIVIPQPGADLHGDLPEKGGRAI
jgi:hypothetical protein